ncbi:MAG: chorismate mutase [Clostridia bacterium]|nr:chorismate mutase [Clostridia bacterium]
MLECRKQIDAIDAQMVDLFRQRMEVASGIAAYKKESGMPVFDSARERDKLTQLAEMAGEDMGNYIRQMYSLLFELSRDYQHKLLGTSSDLYTSITDAIENTPKLFPEAAHVACQGTEGAYSMMAAEKLFKQPDIEYVKTFADVIRAVESGYVRYGVLPVENSTAGIVGAVYKLLEKHDVYAVRSVRCKIEHSLLANPGVKLEDIKEVISHEQAVNQCGKFLSTLSGVKITYAANTAVASKMVRESGRKDLAAISSHACANLYSLNTLARDIHDTDNNYTRFLCISKNIEIFPGADRTSMMLVTNNTPGALYKVLSRFYALGVNLTNLVARPIEGRDFEFRFFCDFDTSVYSESFAALMQTIADTCEEFRYLGSYREMV